MAMAPLEIFMIGPGRVQQTNLRCPLLAQSGHTELHCAIRPNSLGHAGLLCTTRREFVLQFHSLRHLLLKVLRYFCFLGKNPR